MSALIDRYRFEDTLDSPRPPSAACNTPSLSWKSFSAQSWQFTLLSRCRMPFDTTSGHATPQTIIPPTNLLKPTTIPFTSITMKHNSRNFRIMLLDLLLGYFVDMLPPLRTVSDCNIRCTSLCLVLRIQSRAKKGSVRTETHQPRPAPHFMLLH